MTDIILGVKETSSNKAEKTACFSTLALCGHRGGTVWAQRWHWPWEPQLRDREQVWKEQVHFCTCESASYHESLMQLEKNEIISKKKKRHSLDYIILLFLDRGVLAGSFFKYL